jgi:arsenite methyltransferase
VPQYDWVDDAKAADLFDGVAEHYDTDLFHTAVADALIDGLSDMSPPELILDIATGTGSAAFAALRLCPDRVLAVDISPNMITQAKLKAVARDSDSLITWRVAAAVPAPASTASADVVVCASSLHFLGVAALQDWLRVLRPGGRIAFSLPGAATFGPSAAFAALVPPGLDLPQHEHQAAAVATAAGFIRVTARRIDEPNPGRRSAFLVHATKPPRAG